MPTMNQVVMNTTRMFRAGVDMARRVWTQPQQSVTPPVQLRDLFYQRMWSYYANTCFEDLKAWERYRETNNMYRFHRSIYNPTRRLVEFYVGEVYPGVLSLDGKELPDGVPSAIPLADDTDPKMLSAISQFWAWSNWQAGKDIMVRYAAALGNCLVELVDDMERRKVYARIWWPGHVKELGLNSAGDVVAYTLEYEVAETDAEGEVTGLYYTYRKVVTKDTIAFYKDGVPYDYTGTGETEYVNPYGFVPAVWVKHFDMGDDFGQPIVWATLAKIDELNDLASLAHDQLAKIIKAPVVVTTDGATNSLDTQARTPKKADEQADREKVKIIHLPPGSGVNTIPLSMGETLSWLQELIREIEHDHPELAMYAELRGMSTLTGPGASRIMGDVANLVYPAEANYDLQTKKMAQMGVAMAGERIKRGDWGPRGQLTRQQAKFVGFDLSSYDAGNLDFDIVVRPLVDITELERWTTKTTQVGALVAMKQLGFPDAYLQQEAGATEDEVSQFAEQNAQAQETFGAALLGAFDRGNGTTPTNPNTGPLEQPTNALPAASQPSPAPGGKVGRSTP